MQAYSIEPALFPIALIVGTRRAGSDEAALLDFLYSSSKHGLRLHQKMQQTTESLVRRIV